MVVMRNVFDRRSWCIVPGRSRPLKITHVLAQKEQTATQAGHKKLRRVNGPAASLNGELSPADIGKGTAKVPGKRVPRRDYPLVSVHPLLKTSNLEISRLNQKTLIHIEIIGMI